MSGIFRLCIRFALIGRCQKTVMTPGYGSTMTSDTPILRIGIIADPQYAAIPPDLDRDRHYAASLDKLRAAIALFNEADLAFVATLGDIIDRDWRSFDDVLPVYDELRHRNVLLLGNHDFSVASEHLSAVAPRIGMPSPYFDFAVAGHRIVVLDGSDVSLFAPPKDDPRRLTASRTLALLSAQGVENAQPWNGALSEAQFAWLERTLVAAEQAGEAVIVLGHYPVYPGNINNMWDATRLVERLTASANFRAYFCGHNHDGNLGIANGRPFVNFKGMVQTADTNAFAIVSLYADRIEIQGFGREETRLLRLPEMTGRLLSPA